MAWYRAGTVQVTTGSSTVLGTGTQWVSNAKRGEAFYGPDGGLYEIQNIASDAALSISPGYRGITTSGASYDIVPTQGYVRTLASQVADLISLYQSVPQNTEAAEHSATRAQGYANDANTAKVAAEAANFLAQKTVPKFSVSPQVDPVDGSEWTDASTGRKYQWVAAQGIWVEFGAVSALGYALTEYDGQPVPAVLDYAKPLQGYKQLLVYSGRAKQVRITSRGIAGYFEYDATLPNTTNGGTRFKHVSGTGAWSRVTPDNLQVRASWFGAIGNGQLNRLADRFTSLAEAQALYPAAEALSDATDWCAIKAAYDCLNAYRWGYDPVTGIGSVYFTSAAHTAQLPYEPATSNISRGGVIQLDGRFYVVNRTITGAPHVTLQGISDTTSLADIEINGVTPERLPFTLIEGRAFADPSSYVWHSGPYDHTGKRITTFNRVCVAEDKDQLRISWMPHVGLRNLAIQSAKADGENEVYGAAHFMSVSYSINEGCTFWGRYVGVARTGSFECTWGKIVTAGWWGLYQGFNLQLKIDNFAPMTPRTRIVPAAERQRVSAYLAGGLETIPDDKLSLATGFTAVWSDTIILSSNQAENQGCYGRLARSVVHWGMPYEERTGSPGLYGSVPLASRTVFDLVASTLVLTSLQSKAPQDYVSALCAADPGSMLVLREPRLWYGPVCKPLNGPGAKVVVDNIQFDTTRGPLDYLQTVQFTNDHQLDFRPTYLATAYPWEGGKFDYVLFVRPDGSDNSTGINNVYPATLKGAHTFLARHPGVKARIVLSGNAADHVVPADVPPIRDCSIEYQGDYATGVPRIRNQAVDNTSTYLTYSNCKIAFVQVSLESVTPGGTLDRPLIVVGGDCSVDFPRGTWSMQPRGSIFGPDVYGGKLSVHSWYGALAYTNGATSGRFVTAAFQGAPVPLLYEDAALLFSTVSGITLDPGVRRIRSDIVPTP